MVTPDIGKTPKPNGTPGRPAVFFDGSCPLCAAEIATYRKCRGAEDIDWVDVSENKSSTAGDTVTLGLTRAEALRRFHLRRGDGTLVSGGVAFAELWAVLPAFSWAGKIGRLPPASFLLEGAYRLFLPLRPRLQKILLNRHRRLARRAEATPRKSAGK